MEFYLCCYKYLLAKGDPFPTKMSGGFSRYNIYLQRNPIGWIASHSKL